MTQKNLILGMATTVLAVLGFLPWSEATPDRPDSPQSSSALASTASTSSSSNSPDSVPSAATIPGQSAQQASDNSAATPASARPIATTLIHDLNGREVVTLYLRGIPTMTFLGNTAVTPPAGVQVASVSNLGVARTAAPLNAVVQANQLAERLNQLFASGVDAKTIRLAWKPEISSYRIYVGQDPRQDALVTLNSSVIFPQGGKNLSRDALLITNLMRRQLGNAPALQFAEGRNSASMRVATSNFNAGAVRSQFTGMASWYGPGFDGARTASGERFNQFALTAAHKTLPFGTMVRVTNLNNGRSVLVRINDRGPFTPGRSIDLSRGAAEVIGLVSSGVASVRMEVLE